MDPKPIQAQARKWIPEAEESQVSKGNEESQEDAETKSARAQVEN